MGQVLQGQGVGVEGPWVEGAMRTQAEEPPPPWEAALLEEAFVFLTPSCRSGGLAEMGFLQG